MAKLNKKLANQWKNSEQGIHVLPKRVKEMVNMLLGKGVP